MEDSRLHFIESLSANETAFGLSLSSDQLESLADYYELVRENNPILHLVAPCSPDEFAVRHVLESLTLLEFLPKNARFADIGTGAGLPSIPCLIVRDDLRGVLIESKEKKTRFLQNVLVKCKLADRAEILNRQFSEVPKPRVSHVTVRALDKFTQKLPQLLKWSVGCTLLFFGGPALREEMLKLGLKIDERLMPMSEQRFLLAAKAWSEKRND